jgi:hypothetical protein
MKRPVISLFLLVTAVYTLLICCTRESPTEPATNSYWWMIAFSDNFSGATGLWANFYSGNLSNKDGLFWSWTDTSPVFNDSEAIAAGRVHGAASLKGIASSKTIRISMDVQFSSVDSNSAEISLIDSENQRQYLLNIGRSGKEQPIPYVLTLACLSSDSTRKIISEVPQPIKELKADIPYEMVLTVDKSSAQGSLLQEGSFICRVSTPSGAFATWRLSTEIDLEGMPLSPIKVFSFTILYIVQGTCAWKWSDTSAIRVDNVQSATPLKAIGHTIGMPTSRADGLSWGWTANIPLRISLWIKLSSSTSGSAAVTVLDNDLNRKYWLIIGNYGVGKAAAGVLSVIITQAGDSQTVVDQAQQPVQNLIADTCYRLVLTLDTSKVLGEIQQSGSTLAHTEIQSGPIAAGNTQTLSPGIELSGTASSPVNVGGFMVETYSPISGGSSCPFIYSFDGASYTIDAEPYGGSICKGLKRTEWSVLGHLKETHGVYDLLITNELDETQYTDELKLLAIDHPCSLFVAPDVSGGIHTFFRPLLSLSATDRTGNDIATLCSAKDGKRWTGSMTQFDPDGKGEPRDTLTFCFLKPSNAAYVKLLINAGTTAWGATMGKRFLAMYGSGVGRWYDEVDNNGPAYKRIMNWYRNEELYMLKLQVFTRDGWKHKATILGAGPVIAADRVYTIDIHDAPGDTLKVRMAPPPGFWAFDWIAADYSADAPVSIHAVTPRYAYNTSGNDVRGTLSCIDNKFHEAEKGDSVRLSFPVPPSVKGLSRTVVLEANGYYKIHLKAFGLPEFALLSEIDKPGFSARFALQEFRKLERSHMQ